MGQLGKLGRFLGEVRSKFHFLRKDVHYSRTQRVVVEEFPAAIEGQWESVFPASAWITFAEVPLAKASQVAKIFAHSILHLSQTHEEWVTRQRE